ncbi:N-glycosylation protein-domain-containing protein [Chaetomidium leptoderma]|uniref:N-glycosylation protein-domain-containing protein n=1 Tax=Chaetomidium leptoderma TaxID=669021 RepID=A0AAN6VPF6_9PEZI|nr:N-glycosylation protein-domain-containing protein [Chaetomidium leptoderma]
MFNRAKPTAHQPRADNFAKRPPSDSRARGRAVAVPDHAAAHPTAPKPASGSGTVASSSLSTTGVAAGSDHVSPGPVRSTLLQPRVAVALGVSKKWYPALFLCRLVSIVPGVLFGLPNALRLLALLHLMYLDQVLDGGALCKLGRVGGGGGGGGGASSCSSPTSGYGPAFEARLRLTEALLATIWCGASGYLSFFFTDCLMSRWLLNYTPQATIVRLLTVDAINGYLTSWVLQLTGGFEDPRLILPAWIVISTTLTVLYHITQRKINIRKETSMSISVFSIASFVSMVALLAQLHSNRSDYPDIPLINLVRRVIHEAGRLAIRIMEYGDITREL